MKVKSIIKKRGFTLVEVMVATALSVLVFVALYTVYGWSAELSTLCGKKNRSQVAAINSSVRMMDCIRNASQISGIDSENGRWVELTYAGGETAIIAYTNSPEVARHGGGGLGLFRPSKSPIWFVKNGITEMMDEQGFDSAVFSVNSRTNMLYVRYRTSQPSANGGRDINDGKYAMHVRFATCLRNAAVE